jgi:hypothetical protein
MVPLQYFAIGLAAFSGALFFGFLSAAMPNLNAIHLIVTVTIAGIFAATGLTQSRSYISYNRGLNPILVNYGLCALVTIALYWTVIGVGHWTFTPTILPEDSYESLL